jgi:hypothetical protein
MSAVCIWRGPNGGPECGKEAVYQSDHDPGCPRPTPLCLEHGDWLRRQLESGEVLGCICSKQDPPVVHFTSGLSSLGGQR